MRNYNCHIENIKMNLYYPWGKNNLDNTLLAASTISFIKTRTGQKFDHNHSPHGKLLDIKDRSDGHNHRRLPPRKPPREGNALESNNISKKRISRWRCMDYKTLRSGFVFWPCCCVWYRLSCCSLCSNTACIN